MPTFQHHFLPLEPVTATKEECEALETLGTMNFETRADVTLMVRYLGTPNHGIRVIAITLPEVAKDHPDRGKWFRQIIETSITSIRLSYEPDTHPRYTGKGFMNLMTETDDPEPEWGVVMQNTVNPDWRVDMPNVIGVFMAIHGKRKSDIAALLAESQIPSLPPHYAVLSLIRAIELLWPVRNDMNAILDAKQEEFAALEISDQLFRNALPSIRNQCAHGQGRGRGDPEPFIGLGYNDLTLRPLAVMLRSIVITGLREGYDIPIHEASS